MTTPSDPDRALPDDHLAGFEDSNDDAEDSVAKMIKRRTRSAEPAPLRSVNANETVNEPTQRGGPQEPDRGDGPSEPSAPATRPPRRRDTKSQNKIVSTTIHVPYDIHQRFVAAREATGYSNGELMKVAIEETNDKVAEVIGARVPKAGALFGDTPARAPRSARLTDQPLVAVNARFYKADLTVIDQLVKTHGAYSRGHLISTALDLHLQNAGSE